MSSSTWSSSPSTWYDWSYPDDDQSSTSPPSVKEEPDDAPGRFIMEISPPQATSSLISQSLAPPTEVPLRATQASSDMRRMMTVFRLNPFAIHSGEGPMVPAAFESAHPLDTEPITFEFQLDIEPGILDPESPVALNHPDLRSFSPDFDLHEKLPTTHWRDFSHDVSSEHSSTPPPPTQGIQSWDISYPDVEDNFSSINLSGYHQPMSPRRSQRLHNSQAPPVFIIITLTHHPRRPRPPNLTLTHTTTTTHA
ncbi:hypothetical protein H0H93_000746 [Arthromyces matolae]|nr:hypothetical protein H0H93_000746 [Arthromyces matolae]